MSEVIPYTSPRPAVAEPSFAADWLLDPAEIAQRIGGTDFVPQSLRGNAAAITAALLYGQEVGLGRMQSLAKIAVINGRPTLAAEAQRALILAAGHEIWTEESTITRCTIAGRRRGSDQISRVTWTMDDARRAGLAGKQPWRQYPRQMLLARASAELARAIFPDAIGGLSATEELDDAAPDANGTREAAQPRRQTTRKRREDVASATEAGAQPEPEPQSIAADREAQEAAQAPAADAGDDRPGEAVAAAETVPLPPDEQAFVDEAVERFDATDVTDRQDVPQGGPKPEPNAPPDPEAITDPQRRKLHALFRDKGIADRADRLAFCGGVVGRPIPTSTDLTKQEAGQVIDYLEQTYDPANPQTRPLPDSF